MSQLLVLPRVAELRGSETKQEHHPGLTLDKFSFAVEQQEQKAALAPVCRCAGDEPLLRALNRRNDVLLAAGAAKTWTATTEGPLTLHLSRANALENAGIALHPLYGFAYLPGSGLKGAARAYAETIWLQAQPETEREAHSQQIARVFGCAPGSDKGKLWLPQTRQDADASEAGTVVFHDAWPEQWPGLFVDVAAVHHPDYYQASDSSVPPPGDWEPPKPISFLAIKPGTPFRFAVSPRSTGPRPDTALLGLAQNWLNGALATLGIGAKTAAGYGLFQSAGLAPAVLPPTRVAAAFDLTLVTPAFLAGGAQGQEDCDLCGATLRGQLRWWWRTLHAAHLEARLLRRLEAAVWGASSEGSAVQLRLMPGAATEVYRFNFKDEQDGTFLRDNGIDWSHRAAPESERRKTTQGLYYAAYGATPDRVEGRPKPGRFFRQPGSTWQLHLVARASAFRAEAGKDVIALTASGILQQAMAALFLLSRYGGVGAKARKGFGSFDDLDVDGIADISDCKRISAEFRARCGLTSQSSDGDAPSLERMSEPVVVPTSWKNAWFALNRIGEAMQTYAKTGKHEAWKSALGLPRRSDNRNAAFVVNGHLEPKVTDQRISRHLEGGRIKRHAAPVHFHVAKIGDRLAIRLVTFVSPHLPDEATSRQRLEALRSDVRSRLEACKNEGGTAPLSPKPKEVAARVDENDMRVGDVVKAELLEERTLKGGWKARHLPSGSVRSIQNSHMVPSDRKPGDIVDVQVPNRTEFKWPVEKPPPAPPPRHGGPRNRR